MKDLKELTRKDLGDSLASAGYPKFYADQIYEWVYKRGVNDFNLMTNLSKAARQNLPSQFQLSVLKKKNVVSSLDGARKYLLGLSDGCSIEAVFIPEAKRNTLCVSTQAGCKFNCKFCYSAKGGFKRNLKVSEIVNQFQLVSDDVSPLKITNLVFMGVGEPLDNFDNLIKAIEIFKDSKGIYLGGRKITVSTCGLVPQIIRFSDLNLGIKLAISLHAVDDKLRDQLMPINKKYPLKELIKSLKYFNAKTGRPVVLEYLLVHNTNMRQVDVVNLTRLSREIDCKINFIALNSTQAKFEPPTFGEIAWFQTEMRKRNVFYTLRKPRGQDIAAACGQLRYYEGNIQ